MGQDEATGWKDTAELSFVMTGGNTETSALGFKNKLWNRWNKMPRIRHLSHSGFLAVILLTSTALFPTAVRGRTLTFEERVAGQEAIERVYYAHQIGATRPFREAVPREVVERKVQTYLQQSVALAEIWHAPVTVEMLQAEVLRIGSRTLFPSRLREIYTALGNDPFLVLECFVRPVLVERLARGAMAVAPPATPEGQPASTAGQRPGVGSWGEWWSRAGANLDVQTVEAVADESGSLPEVACGEDDSWTPMTTVGAPTPRLLYGTAVWTGSLMVVWGGARITDPPGLDYPADGGRYDPLTDSWTPMTSVNAPPLRHWFPAVWTGNQMIVWGGSPLVKEGGLYDPVADIWTPTSPVNVPHVRRNHIGVWTGSEMIIWGGICDQCEKSGSRYDPATDTWTQTSLVGVPLRGAGAKGIWTGSHMVVWGGGVFSSGQTSSTAADSTTRSRIPGPGSPLWARRCPGGAGTL